MKNTFSKNWQNLIGKELEKPYFGKIREFLTTEIKSGKIIYPHPRNIFKAFDVCDLENLKVVILGQDPYHGEGQAHGLSFSVQKMCKTPPSLQNIYKEINQDLGLRIPTHGNLGSWAKQGVLLLNATLTVRKNEPNSHQNIGWQIFTDEVIKKISQEKENIVFMLWGNFAKQKKYLINTDKHLVLESVHPSPFSANNGFFGNKHFSKTNNYLQKTGQKIIVWEL